MDLEFIKKEEPVEYVLVATQQGQIIHQQTSDQISNGFTVKELLDVNVKQEPDCIWSENEVEANEARLSDHSNGIKYGVREIKQILDVYVKQEPDYNRSENEVEADEARLSAHSDGMKYEVQEIKQLLDVHVKQEPDYNWSENEIDANEAQLSAHSDEIEYEVPKLNVVRSTNSSKSKKRKSKSNAKSYSRIRQRNHKCDKCEATFADKSAFLKHTARHQQSDIDQCKICKIFFPKSIIQFHTESHSGPPYTCKICLKTFLIKQSWNHHRFIHENNNLIECDICGKRVKTKYSMLGHLKVHRERTKDFHCKLCQKSFFRIQTFNYHLKRRHGPLVYTCSNTLCNRVFIEKSSLEAHKCRNMTATNVAKELTNVNRYPCDKCKKIFYNLHHFVLHVAQNCSAKITYQCDYCSKSFLEKGSLIHHFGGQHEIAELKHRTCYQCRKTFSSKSGLKIHLNRVYCNQTLSQTNRLKINKSNKKYAENLNESMGQNCSCDICGCIFVQKAYIVEHMLLVHSKDDLKTKKGCSDRRRIDKLSCSICNKSFQKRYQLLSHIRRMHSVAGTSFVCDICNKSFLSENLYAKHVGGLTCRTKIQCSICSKIFASKGGLVRHWTHCSKNHGILKQI